MLNSGIWDALPHGRLSEATELQCVEASNFAIVDLLCAEEHANDRIRDDVDGEL
jgi:hypothetical protein